MYTCGMQWKLFFGNLDSSKLVLAGRALVDRPKKTSQSTVSADMRLMDIGSCSLGRTWDVQVREKCMDNERLTTNPLVFGTSP